MYEYDNSLVFIDLNDAQILFKMGNGISGLRLKVADVMETQNLKTRLAKILPDEIIISDWVDQHQSYFAAVALEKKMMFIILTLIIAVAAFNLVSTLVMTVNDKRSDIAILRTMGASKKNITNIFMIQGGVSGMIGSLSGTLLGVLLGTYIGNVVHFFETIIGIKIISGNVYLIDYLPSQVVLRDVMSVSFRLFNNCPSNTISPDVAKSKPAKICKRVLFPLPELPTILTVLLCSTSKLIPSKILSIDPA